MQRARRSASRTALILTAALALAACGGGGGSGGPATITGAVLDSSGAPISGANVLLNDQAASLVTTGADGQFSFADVTRPYSLTVKSGGSVAAYRGLTRTSVTLGTELGGGAIRTARLSGTLSGPTFPLPSGEGILLGATNGVLTGSTTNSSGVYTSSTFAWTGASSVTTDVAALHLGTTGGLITSYGPLGKRTGVVLVDGVDQTGLDFSLATAVTTRNTTLTYDPGAYASSGSLGYMTLRAGGAKFLLPGASLSAPSGTSLLMPDGGGTFVIDGQDADGNGAYRVVEAVLGGTTALTLPATTALANSLPADAATGVSKTPTLSWTPVSGATLYVVHLSGSTLNYQFFLPGGSSSLAVPDFTALGLPLAGGTSYSWNVFALQASGIDVDGVTDPSGAGAFSELTLFSVSPLAYYESAGTSFTTAP